MLNERETRVFKGEMFELLFESDDYVVIDRQPLDDLHHGWLAYRIVLREESTGKFFVTFARFNDDYGWEESYGEIELMEVFLKKKMVAFYE